MFYTHRLFQKRKYVGSLVGLMQTLSSSSVSLEAIHRTSEVYVVGQEKTWFAHRFETKFGTRKKSTPGDSMLKVFFFCASARTCLFFKYNNMTPQFYWRAGSILGNEANHGNISAMLIMDNRCFWISFRCIRSPWTC